MNYCEAREMLPIVREVIERNDEFVELRTPGCRILCLWGDDVRKSKGRLVYADTEKVKDKYKVLFPYDYIITFYAPLCKTLNPAVLKHLVYHELLHIDYEEGRGGEQDYTANRYRIRPHDIEDFRSVTDRWGLDWIAE